MRNGQNVLVYAPASLWQVVARSAGGAGSDATEGSGRLLRPHEDSDEGAICRRAREDDLRRIFRRRSSRHSSGRSTCSAACASGRRWRSIRATARCGSPSRRAGARRTSTTRSSGCSSSRRARRRTQAPRRHHLRRIPGGPRPSTRAVPEPDAAVFQAQPEVSHVYLGSKQHLLYRIFNDKNEPFWRSAKQLEIGMIPAAEFAAPSSRERFDGSGKNIAGRRARSAARPRPAGTRTAPRSSPTSTWELVPAGERGVVDRGRGCARPVSFAPSTTTSRNSGTTRHIHSGS